MRQWSLLVALGCALASAGSAGAATVPPRCGVGAAQACRADLAVTFNTPRGTVFVGQAITVEIKVSNAGPDRAYGWNIHVTDPGTAPPPGASSEHSGECILDCNLAKGRLDAGSSEVGSVRLRPQQAGPITISATSSFLGTGLTDPNAANNSSSLVLNAVVGRCTSVLSVVQSADEVIGSIGGDVIKGLLGDDHVYGAKGDDALTGWPGTTRSPGDPETT